jgi:hypothetical protein
MQNLVKASTSLNSAHPEQLIATSFGKHRGFDWKVPVEGVGLLRKFSAHLPCVQNSYFWRPLSVALLYWRASRRAGGGGRRGSGDSGGRRCREHRR